MRFCMAFQFSLGLLVAIGFGCTRQSPVPVKPESQISAMGKRLDEDEAARVIEFLKPRLWLENCNTIHVWDESFSMLRMKASNSLAIDMEKQGKITDATAKLEAYVRLNREPTRLPTEEWDHLGFEWIRMNDESGVGHAMNLKSQGGCVLGFSWPIDCGEDCILIEASVSDRGHRIFLLRRVDNEYLLGMDQILGVF